MPQGFSIYRSIFYVQASRHKMTRRSVGKKCVDILMHKTSYLAHTHMGTHTCIYMRINGINNVPALPQGHNFRSVSMKLPIKFFFLLLLITITGGCTCTVHDNDTFCIPMQSAHMQNLCFVLNKYCDIMMINDTIKSMNSF